VSRSEVARAPSNRHHATSAIATLVLVALLVAAAAVAVPTSLSPAAAQVEDAEPLPAPGAVLAPGRYFSSAVGPRIEFRVAEGWVVGPSGSGPIFTLERSDQPGTVLSFTRFDGDVYLDSCDPSSLSRVEATVPRLTEVIAGNPYLNPGPPGRIEIDGYAGTWLDVATPAYEECTLPVLLIWGLPVEEGGEFVQVAGQQARFVVLDVDGEVVVVAVESLPGVPFGGLLEASLELLDTMRVQVGPAATAPPSAAPGAGSSIGPAATPTPVPETPTPIDPGTTAART
jgi:hypothetical protein